MTTKNFFVRTASSLLLTVVFVTGFSLINPTVVEGQGPGSITCPDGSVSTGGFCVQGPTINMSAPPVQLTFSGSPSSITVGQSATLTWSATNAFTCQSSDFAVPPPVYDGVTYSAFGAVSGSVPVSPTGTKTYSLTCSGLGENFQGSSQTKSVTITVSGAPTTPTTPTNDPVSNGFTSVFQIDNDSNHSAGVVDVPISNADILPGGYTSISTLYTFPSAGTWYARACGDNPPYPNGTVTESSESNNCSAWQTIVIDAPLPDLVGGVTTQGTHSGTPYVIVGTPMTFGGSVANNGTGSATNFPNSFNLQTGGYFAGTAGTLTAGQSGPISGSYTFGATGVYNLRTCADTNTSGTGSLSETDETNNCGAYLAVSVVPQAPASPTATCNANGTSATLSWTASTGASGYYVRASKVGSCPSGWVQAGWDANVCTPSPDTTVGTSVVYPTTPGTAYNFWVHGRIANGAYGPASGTSFTCNSSLPVCSNGVDDDGDGLTDYPADPGCSGPTDMTDGPNPPIITSFTATPNRISSGNSSTLSWSTVGATSCVGTGFNAGGVNSSTVVTPGGLGIIPYSLTCTGATAPAAVANTTLEVITPTATIVGEPSLARDNKTTDLKWSATEVSSCTISASPTGPTFTASYSPVTPGTNTTAVSNINDKTTFTLTCQTTTGGTVSGSTQVNVRFLSDEF